MTVKTAPEIYIVENSAHSANKNSFKRFVSNLQRRSESRWTIFGNYSRFAILTLSMLCMTIMGSNSVLLNFTIICMTHSAKNQIITTTPGTFSNATLPELEVDDYSAQEKGWMFSAVAIGGIIGILPTPFLITRFGLRTIYTICGLLSALFTFTMPFTEDIFGFTAIFAMRFVQGFTLAPSMPCLTQIPHYWAPVKEQALYMALLSCYMQLGIIFTMPVTGALCESSWEWPATYYLHGGLCAFFFTLFFIFFRDTPGQSWFISNSELDKLESDWTILTSSTRDKKPHGASSGQRQKIPYKQMLSDSSMWGCLSAGTGSALAYYFFALYGPTYMNKVLKVTVENTGIYVAIPFVLAIGGKLLFGPGMDTLGIFSLKARIVWTTIIAQLFNVISYVVLGIFPATSALLSQIFIIVVLVSNGVGFVGLARNAQVTAQQHSHFIMAIIAMINSIVTLVLPLAIQAIAGENTNTEWSLIFFIMAAILFVLDVGFALFAKTAPRPWTEKQ